MYKYYPNKKSSHIKNYFKDKFLKEGFDEIVIDNIKRNETTFNDHIISDIKHSKSCYIIINKSEVK